ncbi:MAG: hypothetical protein KDA72_07280 [Planctomycetales bacterium]|nr:hypothetical protein [Planctomycetales bacterium]
MKIRSNGMLPAMGLISSLFFSAGCAMPQRRVSSIAQQGAAQETVKRSVANIKYDTSVPAVEQNTKYPSASTDDYRSPTASSTSQATESKSGGSCCH